MKVKVSEIREKMLKALSTKGYKDPELAFIIDMYLGGELRGHITHGLSSFKGFVDSDFSKLPKPEVIKETHASIFIDAKSNPGVLIGRQAADKAMEKAKNEIVGVTLIKNMEGWLRPGGIAEYICGKDFVGIVINDGGGGSVAPPGGYFPALGTNPIAYGLPTQKEPLVVDLATSKMAWGNVRLANKYGTNLPEDTFYDDKGNVTLDPKKAYSVKPFGDYKGFALALLVEVLCDSLLGMDMMVQSTAGMTFAGRIPDRGALIIVFDPKQTVGLDNFKKDNSDLLERIDASLAIPGQEIRIPGEHASKLRAKRLKEDLIDIPDELWREIKGL